MGLGGHDDVRGRRHLRLRLPDAVARLAPDQDPRERERPGTPRRHRCPHLSADRRRREGREEHVFGPALPGPPAAHDPDRVPLRALPPRRAAGRGVPGLLHPPRLRVRPHRLPAVFEVRPRHVPHRGDAPRDGCRAGVARRAQAVRRRDRLSSGHRASHRNPTSRSSGRRRTRPIRPPSFGAAEWLSGHSVARPIGAQRTLPCGAGPGS